MFEPTFQRHVMNLVLCHSDHEILYWPRIEAPLYGIPSACATSDNRHISRKRDFFFLLPLAGELNDHAITSIAVWTFCKAFFSCSQSTQCAKISFLLFSTKSEQSHEVLFRIRILDLIAHSNLQRRMTQSFYLILSFSPICHLQCPRCLLTSFQHLLLSTLTIIIVSANLPKLGIISHFRCVTTKQFCNLVLVMPLQQSILVSNDHYHIHYSSNNIIIY